MNDIASEKWLPGSLDKELQGKLDATQREPIPDRLLELAF